MSDKIVRIADYVQQIDTSGQTYRDDFKVDQPVVKYAMGGTSSQSRLRPSSIYGDIDTEFGRYNSIIDDLIIACSECIEMIAEDQFMSADDRFMSIRQQMLELFMYRDLSDSVGLLTLKMMQSVKEPIVISDAPQLPSLMLRILARLQIAPYMDFSEACALAEEIERSAKMPSSEAYNLVADGLLEESTEQAN